MGQGSLGGRPFRIDPSSIHWAFTIKTAVIETLGGRVVQVIGANLGDMTVNGSFGVGGWQEQQKFLGVMRAMAQAQVASGRIKNSTAPAVHFRYPPRKWDLVVSLLSFEPVTWEPAAINQKWQVRLFIEEDNSGITKIAQDAYISRFAAGLGWKNSQYNGPMSQADVDATLAGQDPGTYLAEHYGQALPQGTG